jgi:hypothetical protein
MIILFFVYIVLGGMAVKYVKRNVFGIVTVGYLGKTSDFLIDRLVTAFILGWLAIPVAVIVWIFKAIFK